MESVERTNQQYSWQFQVDCVQLKKTSAPSITSFFPLHSWLVEKLQRDFWSDHKASFGSWYEARENACSRDYSLLFSLLIGWEVRARILIQWQSYFLLPAQSAGKRVLPWLPHFFYLQPWLVGKLERGFLTKHKATFCSRREARENACSRDYPCFLHSWLVEKSEREFNLIAKLSDSKLRNLVVPLNTKLKSLSFLSLESKCWLD